MDGIGVPVAIDKLRASDPAEMVAVTDRTAVLLTFPFYSRRSRHLEHLQSILTESRHLVLVPPWRRKPVPQKTRARLRDSHFLETKSRRQPDCCPLRFGRKMEIRSLSRVSSLRREGHLGVRDIEVDEKEAPIGAATVRERCWRCP